MTCVGVRVHERWTVLCCFVVPRRVAGIVIAAIVWCVAGIAIAAIVQKAAGLSVHGGPSLNPNVVRLSAPYCCVVPGRLAGIVIGANV